MESIVSHPNDLQPTMKENAKTVSERTGIPNQKPKTNPLSRSFLPSFLAKVDIVDTVSAAAATDWIEKDPNLRHVAISLLKEMSLQ